NLAAGAFTNITGVGTLTGLAVNGATTLTSSAAAAVPLSVVGASGQTGDLVDVTANGGAAGGVFNIASNGNINASGTLSGLTGLTSSGTVTLTGLASTGVVHNNASGVLSTSLISNADLAGGTYSSITGLGTLGSLTVSGATSLGSLTASGTVTFSSLNSAGIVHTNASGQLSTGLLTNADFSSS